MQDMRPRNLLTGLVVVTAALAIVMPAIRSYARASAFIIRMADIRGWPARAAAVEEDEVAVSDLQVPWRGGQLRARAYVPAHVHRAVILVAGVNALGIDEPRLTGLANQLAETGTAVVTPELPDLQRYDITPRTTDMIEDAALWLSDYRDLAPDYRVGLVGISFAGGLSVVAAGRPELRDRVAFVVAFGGHGDFPRVVRFLCTGMEPVPPPPGGGNGPAPRDRYRAPHDYGVAILLLGLAQHVVPAGQVEPLRASILTFLHASHMDLIDKGKAAEEFAEARRMAQALPDPARTLMAEVNARDVRSLGPKLLPFIDEIGRPAALSPDRSPAPAAPVFLLHGTDDNVVPAAESELLAGYLAGKTRVRVLLSPLITHAEIDRPPRPSEVWKLVSFFADVFRR